MKILIDTDIGGDVDDAIALAMALNSPSLDIVGITNVYWDNTWRGKITRQMLDVFGRPDIPVLAGAEKPLIGEWKAGDMSPSAQPAEDLSDACRQTVPDEEACDFIVRKAREENDLTVVAIGPLTNLALALAKAPDIQSRIKIVMMGGQLEKAWPEWNILCDPEAAAIVFESAAPIVMVGLDVTNRCQLTREEMDQIGAAGNPRADLLYQMMTRFTKNFGYLPILHDPLAMSLLLWDDLVRLEPRHVLVETSGKHTRGVTVDAPENQGRKIMAAVDVKAASFKKRVIDLVSR